MTLLSLCELFTCRPTQTLLNAKYFLSGGVGFLCTVFTWIHTLTLFMLTDILLYGHKGTHKLNTEKVWHSLLNYKTTASFLQRIIWEFKLTHLLLSRYVIFRLNLHFPQGGKHVFCTNYCFQKHLQYCCQAIKIKVDQYYGLMWWIYCYDNKNFTL